MRSALTAAGPIADLLDRSRALQHATAAVTADARATFARLLASRAALRACLAPALGADRYPAAA